MADYKRMVSYMYQYENGVKKKNVGYARIEAKNGQCKITLHMQLPGQLDSIFPTYLIQRDENGIDLVYLGDAVLKSQVMDSKLTADEKNIMNSGHSLSEMGGLLLFLHDKVFYATEWDDKPIVAKEVLSALKPKKKEVLKEQSTNDTITMEQTPDLLASTISTKNTEPIVTVLLSPEGFSLEEELNIPKYKLPRGWKIVERLRDLVCDDINIQAESELEDKVAMEQDSVLAENLEPGIVDSKEPQDALTEIIEATQPEELIPEESKEVMSEEPIEVVVQDSKEEAAEDSKEVIAAESKVKVAEENELTAAEGSDEAENPIAKQLFDTYPRIYPFEDNEILLCVKIEPKDIGILPKYLWALSNNSFLMHGFYCYHHLIFAKIKDHFGCRYILGIPGIYHNRERFMARMFGFESFKSIRKRDLQQGDFGYWHLDVNF